VFKVSGDRRLNGESFNMSGLCGRFDPA